MVKFKTRTGDNLISGGVKYKADFFNDITLPSDALEAIDYCRRRPDIYTEIKQEAPAKKTPVKEKI